MMNMKGSYKKIGVVVFMSIFAIMAFASIAHAQATPGTSNAAVPNWYNWVTSPGTSAIMLISVVVNYILNFAVTFGAILINFGLGLDGNLYNSPTVQIGFSVALSIANLGFVLGIIVIAIATILRSESYGIKQVLWKLIAMAILVNFGLVLTGPIVGLADNFTGYFLQASGGASNFANNLTTAFAPNGFNGAPQITSNQQGAINQAACNALGGGIGGSFASWICTKVSNVAAGGDTSGASDFMRAITSGAFSAAFIGITAFTFIIIGIMLFIRYLYLVFLLILLPLAWLTWIFPKFNYFSKWWGLFLKWTFFPAVSLFFIYLATQTVTVINNQVSVSIAQPSGAFTAQNGASSPYLASAYQTGQVSWYQNALDELVLVGLCLGGLFAANSLTDKGADSVVHAGKWAGGYVAKKTQGARQRAGRNITDRARSAGKQYNPATKETTTALQRFGSRLQGIPGLRGPGTTLANKSAPAAFHGERKEDIKKYVDENLKNLTNDGLVKRATSATAFVNPTQSAAIAQEIARRNLTLDPQIAPLMDRYVAVAERMGTLEAITNNRPDLTPVRKDRDGNPVETQLEATARAVKSAKGEIIQANPQIFNAHDHAAAAAKLGSHVTPAVLETAVLALSPSQLGTLGNDQTTGSQERQNNITEAVKDLVAPFKKAILDANQKPTGKFEIDTTALANAAAKRPELKNLDKIVKHMESSPNWGSVLS